MAHNKHHIKSIIRKAVIQAKSLNIRAQIKAAIPPIMPLMPANKLLFFHVHSLYMLYVVLSPKTLFFLIFNKKMLSTIKRTDKINADIFDISK